MKVTFSGERGDSFCLDMADTVTTLNGNQLLTEHVITNDEELDAWRYMVRNWYVYEVGTNYVTFINEEFDGDWRTVCLKCGYASVKNFCRCPSCRTLEEPVYLKP